MMMVVKQLIRPKDINIPVPSGAAIKMKKYAALIKQHEALKRNVHISEEENIKKLSALQESMNKIQAELLHSKQ